VRAEEPQALLEERSLWRLVERRAAATPNALFAVDEHGRSLDFAGYREAALGCAAGLRALGVKAGDGVSWQLPTGLDSLVLVGALARLGTVQNPILPMLRRREVGFMVRQTGARHLFVPARFRGFDYEEMARGISEEEPGLQLHVLRDRLPEGDATAAGPDPEAPAAGTDPVRWIFYSSGTTADPKGARHGESSLAAAGAALCRCLELGPEDRNALVFPLTHVGGIAWLCAGLMAGFAQIDPAVFEPRKTCALLAEHGVTQAGAGTVFHQAYLGVQRERGEERLFPRLRSCPGGGAPKPPGLHAEVKGALGGAGVISGYGLTEYPIATMGTPRDPDAKLARCEGRATPGTEIRIVRPDGGRAGAGEEGEIRLRGPHAFRGYVDRALDAQAFDADGFFRSGDLGYLDAEGYLTVTGRLKDVIVRKGENISAKEVEDHLHAHPQVAEAAAIGLPDAERGELLCAVVVPRETAHPPSLGDLDAFLRGRGLARQKVPERLEIVGSLPRNASGKVLKKELQQRFS